VTKAKVDSTIGIRIELQSAERKELRKALRARATADLLKAISGLAGPIFIGGGIAGGVIGGVYIWKQADDWLDKLFEPWRRNTRKANMNQYIKSESTMDYDDWLVVRNSWRFRLFQTYSEEDWDAGFRTTWGAYGGEPPARYKT